MRINLFLQPACPAATASTGLKISFRDSKKYLSQWLTARGHEHDIAAGIEGGAEDYIVKPFSFPELIARVSTALARHAR